jgi:type I restriction enzyme S subunit
MYGATVGKLGILGIPAATNQAVCAIFPSPELDRRFLFHFLLSIREKLIEKSTGGAQPNISQTIVRDLKIPLPPLAEQQRIVDILDRAAAIQRLRRAAEEKAREIIPALFVDMFGDPATNPKGWPMVPLGDVLLAGPQNGLYRPASDYGTGTRILRIDSFDDGNLSDQGKLRRLNIDMQSVEKFGLCAGDIVVNRVNSPPQLGKSIVVPELEEPTVFESNMMRMRLNPEKFIPAVVGTMLQLASVRKALTRNAKHAINQSSINQGDVTSVPVLVPPLPLQKAFAERAQRLGAIMGLSIMVAESSALVSASLAAKLISAT